MLHIAMAPRDGRVRELDVHDVCLTTKEEMCRRAQVDFFDYNATEQPQPQPLSSVPTRATATQPSPSATLDELLSKPPRAREPALGERLTKCDRV